MKNAMINGAILDTILTQKHLSELQPLRSIDVLEDLLAKLSNREKDVLLRRYALNGGEPVTLEHIGQQLGVTRERIRQVAKQAINKLQESALGAEAPRHFFRTLEQILRAHGGIAEVNFSLDLLRRLSGLADEHTPETTIRLIFLLDNIAPGGQLEYRAPTVALRARYAVPGVPDEHLEEAVSAALAIVDNSGIPLTSAEMVRRYINTAYWQGASTRIFVDALAISKDLGAVLGEQSTSGPNELSPELTRLVISFLALTPLLQQNIFGEWGRASWPTIKPRRMNDKIYLMLKRESKPLHFTEIADRVNAAKFDTKHAKASSVHNELILDDRFVLIGRGTYALKEWGFERGTVADVIVALLTEAAQPMSREEIVAEVLKQRAVKKQTIHLSLMDKKHFTRLTDGRYDLATSTVAP